MHSGNLLWICTSVACYGHMSCWLPYNMDMACICMLVLIINKYSLSCLGYIMIKKGLFNWIQNKVIKLYERLQESHFESVKQKL